MTTSKVYKNDTGTNIILNAGSDITGHSSLKIKYQKPSGDTGNWNASVYESTKAKYVTISGDLNEAGTWLLRLYVVLSGWSGHGNVTEMKVYNEWEQ